MSKANRTLLVVDDDPGMRSQLKWGLNNFEVMTADDRIHALEVFSKHRPPVVTLDLGLPPDTEGIQEGFETLRLILAIAPHTYVFIVSGATGQDNEKKAEACGAYRYFTKPVDISKLNAAVEQAYLLSVENREKVQ